MNSTTTGLRSLMSMLALGMLACSDSPTGVSRDSASDQPTVQAGYSPTGEVALPVKHQWSFAGANASVVAEQFAGTITVGAPATSSNRFPFGGPLGGFAGTRYQQAYSAAEFNATAPLLISKISFENGTGGLYASTYTFYLSTITAGVDELSLTDFDGNRGVDNTLFATVVLEGAAPPVLTITGVNAFPYDPAQGNLLLDIVVAPGGVAAAIPATFAYRNNGFGIFSRYQNFGFGSTGLGLVTTFELVNTEPTDPEVEPEPTMESLLAAVQQAVLDGTLEGAGAGNSAPRGLTAWLNILNAARRVAETGNGHAACAQLLQAQLRADGESPPQDFVTGTALPALVTMIESVRGMLSCK